MSDTVSLFFLSISINISLFVYIAPLPFSSFLNFNHPVAGRAQQHQVTERLSKYSRISLVMHFKRISAISPASLALKTPVEPQCHSFPLPFIAPQVCHVLSPIKPRSLLFHRSPFFALSNEKMYIYAKFAGIKPATTLFVETS